jgi:hypothetical protein
VKENVYRLVQIEAVLHSRSKAAKRERYVRRLKAFRWQHPEEFSKSLQSCFSPFAAAAAKSLCQGNARAFSLHMRLARVHFVVREALRAPLRTIRQALVRRAENRLRFYTRPCGTVLKVWAFGTDERAALVEALNALTRKNAVDEWSELAASERSLTEDRLSVLEQGGILIRWTAAGEADMLLEQGAGSARITRELLAMLVRRHRILQGSEQAVGPVEAVSA